jgi:hypothetical protein
LLIELLGANAVGGFEKLQILQSFLVGEAGLQMNQGLTVRHQRSVNTERPAFGSSVYCTVVHNTLLGLELERMGI